ncbi:DDE_3 domain-containing protein [Trichonephila clavipes]|nr:DDE_3 domain-containing protein [Trichonephila clavipes]
MNPGLFWGQMITVRGVVAYNSLHTVLRHTARTAGAMVWGAIAYDTRPPLIVMLGPLTVQGYVDDIIRPHVGTFLNDLPGAIF